ncbi:MAG: NAD(P)H-dependent oxidoreductase [Bauldia sp.]|nr:NAD(P)H-dependent oxidoreductase [Bauldia sp.]
MNPTKILVFAGSIRSGALSAKLAAAAAKELALADAEVTQISLADYPLPIYDGDLEAEKGVPENATALARLLIAHQGVFIATPEYNHSLPPLVKNTLDWVSRIKHSGTMPYRHKVYGMGATSDGRFGGARAIIELRKVLATSLGAIVIPSRIEVPLAQHAFDESGELIEEVNAKMLKTVCRQLVDFARKMAD